MTATSPGNKLLSHRIKYEAIGNFSPRKLLLTHLAPCFIYTFNYLRTNVWVNIQTSPLMWAFLIRTLNSCFLNYFSLKALFIQKSLTQSRNCVTSKWFELKHLCHPCYHGIQHKLWWFLLTLLISSMLVQHSWSKLLLLSKTYNPEDFNTSLQTLSSTVSIDFNETCTFKNVGRGLKIWG